MNMNIFNDVEQNANDDVAALAIVVRAILVPQIAAN